MTEDSNGVRTVGQHDLGRHGDGMQVLRRIGATFAQGYLFSHPVPPGEVRLDGEAGGQGCDRGVGVDVG